MGAVTGLSALSGISIFASPAPAAGGLDPDAAAYIANVEAADGLSLEEATKTAINDFVVGCKADGIWAAMESVGILAGARTLAGALVPLKGPAPTNVGFVSGDYNRATGLKGDGTKYLDSNYANETPPGDNAHMAAWVSDIDTSTGVSVYGIHNNGGRSAIFSFGIRSREFGSSRSMGFSDFIGHSRAPSNDVDIKGVTLVTLNYSPDNPVAGTYFVFARNVGGSPFGTSAHGITYYSAGRSLGIETLESRVRTLMTYFSGL